MVKIKVENIKKTFNPRSRNKNQVLKAYRLTFPKKVLSPSSASRAAAKRRF